MITMIQWVHFILRKLFTRSTAPHDRHSPSIQTPKAEDSIFSLRYKLQLSRRRLPPRSFALNHHSTPRTSRWADTASESTDRKHLMESFIEAVTDRSLALPAVIAHGLTPPMYTSNLSWYVRTGYNGYPCPPRASLSLS